MKRLVGLAIGAVALGTMATSPGFAQATKNVTAMIEAFGKSCVPPNIDMAVFGRELWQARGLIVVDILMADGPGKSLMDFVFDTDGERFRATFPELAGKGDITLPNGWKAVRSVDMTRFRNGDMNGSDIPRPMLLCTASAK